MSMVAREIPYGRPMIGDAERQAVLEVLQGPILVHGPRAHKFEERFARHIGAPHAVSVSSCTAALHLCYFSLGIGPGDEVIVPAESHLASAHTVELCGARAVFVDAERATGNIDIDRIEEHLTPRTRAISVAHYLGIPVEMDRVLSIARKRDLFVVEDCATALGASYRGIQAGMLGDAGCFSFYPVKHITTGEGGMITTRHEEVARKTSRQRAFGMDKNMSERTIPGIYDAPTLGFNYRMNEMAAALGICQLERLAGFLRTREENYLHLEAALRPVEELHLFRATGGGFRSSYYCLGAVLREELAPRRGDLLLALKRRGIGCSVHYPKALPLSGYYREKYGYRAESYPVAAWISDASVALPVGPHLNRDDMDAVAAGVKSAIAEIRGRP